MNVADLIEKSGVEIDDVRWYLATEQANRILTYRDDSDGLISLIHSGRLEADWYRMEERFVEELQEKSDKRLIDEPELKKLIVAIKTERDKRPAR